MSKWYLGWHFLPDDGKPAHMKGLPLVKAGEGYFVDPPLQLCYRGLHFSVRALDALKYAPGSIACRVIGSGHTKESDDKMCSSERTVLALADATSVLHEFACRQAESVLDYAGENRAVREKAIATKRLWLDGKASCEELDAADSAALSAARSAALSAARSTADSAAYSAALSAACYAAYSAAYYAANSAAYYAAYYAADSAARSTANSAANSMLESMLFELLGIDSPEEEKQFWEGLNT